MTKVKKWLKYTVYALLGIVSISMITIASIVLFVNPNKFKPVIAESVYKSTGRSLTISGDISWKIYPNLGIVVNGVTLSNPESFDGQMMSLKSANVSVALLPLLDNRIVVKSLMIDGLDAHLIKKNDINNWTFVASKDETSEEESSKGAKPLYLEMTKFSVTHSNITFDDFDKPQHFKLDNTNLVVDTKFGGIIKFDQATGTVELNKVSINYNDALVGDVNVRLQNFESPIYSADLNFKTIKINTLAKQFAITGIPSADFLNQVSLSGGINGDINNIDAKDLNFNFGDKVKGNLSVNLRDFKKPTYNGNLNLEPFNLNKVLDAMKISVQERRNMSLLNDFAISSKGFSGNTNSINLNGFSVSVGKIINVSFSNLSLNNLTNKTPTINATSFNLKPLNLNQALDALNIAKTERKGMSLLNSFAMSSGVIAGNAENITFKNANVLFGNSLKASFPTLTLINSKTPSATGSVNVPIFSLNNVMQQLAMEPVKITNKHILDAVSINTVFNASANSMKLTNMNAILGKSKIAGNLNVSSFKPLALDNNITIDKIDVADFSDINGYKLPISGLKMIGKARIASNMNMATLNATQSVSMNQILVYGVDVNKLVLQLNDIINSYGKSSNTGIELVLNSTQVVTALNKMKERVAQYAKPGAKDLSQVTDLGTFNGNAVIVNGKVSPSNFSLSGKTLKMSGNGSVNLVGKREILYKTNSQLLTKGINPIFEKLVVTTDVSGSIDNPSASLDWMSLQQQILKYIVQQNTTQIKNIVGQQINNAVGNQVKQAVGQQTGNKAIDAVSDGVTNALGKLFGN